MATRLYGTNPSETLEQVREGAGSATSSAIVALTVDLATNAITEGSTTRQITKSEVVLALDLYKEYIIKGNWPPA